MTRLKLILLFLGMSLLVIISFCFLPFLVWLDIIVAMVTASFIILTFGLFAKQYRPKSWGRFKVSLKRLGSIWKYSVKR